MARGGERRFFQADGVRGVASRRMEKRRCWYEGNQGGERRGAGVSSGRMECAPLLVRRESRPEGDGDECRTRLEVAALKP